MVEAVFEELGVKHKVVEQMAAVAPDENLGTGTEWSLIGLYSTPAAVSSMKSSLVPCSWVHRPVCLASTGSATGTCHGHVIMVMRAWRVPARVQARAMAM